MGQNNKTSESGVTISCNTLVRLSYLIQIFDQPGVRVTISGNSSVRSSYMIQIFVSTRTCNGLENFNLNLTYSVSD